MSENYSPSINIGIEKMIHRFRSIIDSNLDKKEYSLSNRELSKKMGMSERNFSRRIQALTGMSPQKYVRQYRLEKAKGMIAEGKFYTVSEIANAVGFTKTAYFSHKFKEYFGKKPLEMLREHGWR